MSDDEKTWEEEERQARIAEKARGREMPVSVYDKMYLDAVRLQGAVKTESDTIAKHQAIQDLYAIASEFKSIGDQFEQFAEDHENEMVDRGEI